MSREDIENELSTIDHSRVEYIFDIALLRRRKIVIEQNYVRRNRGGCARNFLQFAFADERCRLRPVAALSKLSGDFGPGAGG
jgi:hypothetical protein